MNDVIVSFLPIVLLLVIITIVFVISNVWKKYVGGYRRGIKWLFALYIMTLLIAACISYILPIEKPIKEEKVENVPYIYDYIESGRKDEIDPRFIRRQWEYSLAEEELQIYAPENNFNGTTILVERTDDLKDKVEVTFYQTPTYMYGKRMTDQAPLPIIKQEKNVLYMMKPEEVSVEENTFKREFPFNQFTGEEFMSNGADISYGQDLLFVRIDHSIKVHLDESAGMHIFKSE